jgi:single-stranded DNA-binding protein
MNKYLFDGHLVTDPEAKDLKNSTVVKFNVRNVEGFKMPSGETSEAVLYLNCEAWGRLGDQAIRDLKKGDRGNFEGKFVIEKWTEHGEKKVRYLVKLSGYEKI